LVSSYYRGAQGVILVFDLSNPSTLDELNHWIQELEQHTTEDARPICLLVGNKLDLWKETQEAHVLELSAHNFAKKHQCLFMMCSAKKSQGIEVVFNVLIEKVCCDFEKITYMIFYRIYLDTF
jgi:Ras-related protein Rab-18